MDFLFIVEQEPRLSYFLLLHLQKEDFYFMEKDIITNNFLLDLVIGGVLRSFHAFLEFCFFLV